MIFLIDDTYFLFSLFFVCSKSGTLLRRWPLNKIRENVHFLVLHIIEELKNSGFEPVDCELKILTHSTR